MSCKLCLFMITGSRRVPVLYCTKWYTNSRYSTVFKNDTQLSHLLTVSSSKMSAEEKLVVSKRRAWYTPAEIALHNCAADCWVSVFGKVYELSALLEKSKGPLCQPIIKFAGEDVSSWFDTATGDVKTQWDPENSLVCPFLPHGRFLHVPPVEPVSNWRTDFGSPWWRDEKLCIGSLSQKTRKVRVVNTLTRQEALLEVCAEETLEQILDRYLDHNAHAASYTWKTLDEGDFRPLDMQKNLADNGIADESGEFESLRIDSDYYYPVLHLYYNDDLTVSFFLFSFSRTMCRCCVVVGVVLDDNYFLLFDGTNVPLTRARAQLPSPLPLVSFPLLFLKVA